MILLALYWVVGVIVISWCWFEDFGEVSLFIVFAACLMWWVIWPFALLEHIGKDIIIYRRKGDK